MNLELLRRITAPKPVLLGPPPWTEEQLRKAYFINFTDTQKAIRCHPGYPYHRELESLELSIAVFNDSIEDLRRSIDLFRSQRSERAWNERKSKDLLKQSVVAVRRGVFCSASAAMALVDHSRSANKRLRVPGYQDQVKQRFVENEKHIFIQDLRNCIMHVRMLPTDWQIRKTVGQEHWETRFFLRKEVLLDGWTEWKALSRDFIHKAEHGIDVERLFLEYNVNVRDFHDWYAKSIETLGSNSLREYREYERMLKAFGSRTWWNLLIDHALKAGIDPYERLTGYLDKEQMGQISSVPHRTKEQVNKIIELVDEYRSCDEELRQKIYRLFNVDPV